MPLRLFMPLSFAPIKNCLPFRTMIRAKLSEAPLLIAKQDLSEAQSRYEFYSCNLQTRLLSFHLIMHELDDS
jgi:hypothetical protein